MSRPACSSLSLTVRTARSAAEIDDAAALYVRSGTAAFTWRPESHFRAADFRMFAQDEEVWLALMGEALVGILAVFRPENFIHCLYVDPDAQRLGVGRALVAHVRRLAGAPLTLKLDVPNRRAIRFYEATGWHRLTGLDDQGVDDAGITWARYRLD
ncbi:MAG TPA: GNAT family N-acetyltransferase [Rhizomicrobium sp.]|jgi:GNAT superfamily N-acetyltransferase|nr:GNAT family N-acetyltransferase [Rhizomicrobium sp.]